MPQFRPHIQVVRANVDVHELARRRQCQEVLRTNGRSDRTETASGRPNGREDRKEGFLRPMSSLRAAQRDLVSYRDREYQLNESEARTLDTIARSRWYRSTMSMEMRDVASAIL